jgi:hypothetical protein
MLDLVDQIWAMSTHDNMQRQLAHLETEHRSLDDVITRIAKTPAFDQLEVQRMKKRRLMIKDEIVKLRGKILPDIIA